jgi:virulence factor Mce-like protein
MSPFGAGVILIVVVVAGVYFGFTKHIPFTHGFRLNGVFSSAVSIRKNSPVRIAGVDVGKVSGVRRAGDANASIVSIELKDTALPIHKDATMKIRPRIFLEGNFFVDLKPGTPDSPKLADGDPIGITQTAAPVQLDEVLTSLQSDARQDLQDVLAGVGGALTRVPTLSENRSQDPDVQGRTAAQALNKSYASAPAALRGAAIVNSALLGSEPHDLSKLIRSFGRTAAALDRNESALKGLVTNLNVTTGAFAAQAADLSATIRLLAPTLQTANRTLIDLNAAFPPTRAFAREILPGVRQTPATVNAAFPWIEQTRRLLGINELQGVARELRPASADLARLIDRAIPLLPQIDLVSKCANDVVLPVGDIVIDDGPQNSNPNIHTGVENYKEFWYTLVALSGEGQNFDGNGIMVRFQPGGGPFSVSTGSSTLTGLPLLGNAVAVPQGTRPKYPGKRPPYNPTFPCFRNPLPNVNGAVSGPPEVVRARNAKPLSKDPRLLAGVPAARSPREGAVGQGGTGGQAPARPGASRQPAQTGAAPVTDQVLSNLNPFAGAGPGKP